MSSQYLPPQSAFQYGECPEFPTCHVCRPCLCKCRSLSCNSTIPTAKTTGIMLLQYLQATVRFPLRLHEEIMIVEAAVFSGLWNGLRTPEGFHPNGFWLWMMSQRSPTPS